MSFEQSRGTQRVQNTYKLNSAPGFAFSNLRFLRRVSTMSFEQSRGTRRVQNTYKFLRQVGKVFITGSGG